MGVSKMFSRKMMERVLQIFFSLTTKIHYTKVSFYISKGLSNLRKSRFHWLNLRFFFPAFQRTIQLCLFFGFNMALTTFCFVWYNLSTAYKCLCSFAVTQLRTDWIQRYLTLMILRVPVISVRPEPKPPVLI